MLCIQDSMYQLSINQQGDWALLRSFSATHLGAPPMIRSTGFVENEGAQTNNGSEWISWDLMLVFAGISWDFIGFYPLVK